MKPLLIFALAVSTAFAGNLSPDLHPTGNNPITVVVQFTTVPDNGLLGNLASNGAVVKRQFKHLPKIRVYTMPAGMVNGVAHMPGVKYISPDRPVKKHLDLTAATVGSRIANAAGWTGQGVAVAVIDSGIDVSNSDLKTTSGASRVLYSEDFTGESITLDLFGHGTHVAGIIGGNGTNSTGMYQGIAPQVSLVNLRALDENGVGSDGSVVGAIDRAIDLAATYNIRVINLSLGRPVFDDVLLDPLCIAAEAAYRAGIVVVAAAGNDGRDNSFGNQGYGTINSPGDDPVVITVGAMKAEGTTDRSDDLIASYSSKGPTLIDHFVKPDLVAPGNIVSSLRVAGSTLDNLYPANRIDPSVYGGASGSASAYFSMNGTSMATPVVSGAAALLLQQNPAMTADQVKARLMLTATKSFPVSSVAIDAGTGVSYTSYYDAFTIGAGYIDIMAALNSTALSTGVAISPVAIFNADGTVHIVNPNQFAWDDQFAWDSQFAWDDQFAWDSQFAWDDSVVWGARVVSGSNVLAVNPLSVVSQHTSTALQSILSSTGSWDSGTASANAILMTKGEK